MLRSDRIRPTLLVLPLALALAACSGTRTAGQSATVYATSFNLVGIPIPYNDYERAQEMVPAGADIETVFANPRDWTSFFGILTSIFGFSSTQITYELENEMD